MNNCELCSFKNPKGTATAVIIQGGKLLLLTRAEEPFRGWWDLPGGYLIGTESPQDALQREIKEELGVTSSLTKIGEFPGTSKWKNFQYPIISHVFLAEISGMVSLDEENYSLTWVPVKDLDIHEIAFDSNQRVAEFIKKNLNFDIPRIKELVSQLDSSSSINEQSLYKAVLNGFVSKKYDGDKLIGMGWIFPRQTILRKQAVIEDMIVDEAYRGKGIGTEIVNDLISWAKKENCDTIELTSGWHREAAHALYKKVGFTIHNTAHMLLNLK